jgi:hypothetical protein
MTSKYKGVSWLKERKKWRVQIRLKGEKPKYGGIFRNELDAAKEVNQLCEELGIPPKNPEINAILNTQYQVTTKYIFRILTNLKLFHIFSTYSFLAAQVFLGLCG